MKNEKKAKKGIRGRITAFLVGIVFAVLAMGALYIYEKFGSANNTDNAQPTVLDIATQVTTTDEHTETLISISHVEETIKPASELITTKYYYKDADTNEDSKKFLGVKMPFTTNKFVFTYEGTVSIGVEFSEIKVIGVDNQNKRITIKIPDAKVIANEIDAESFQVYDVKSSVFNDTDMKEYTDLIATLKQEKEAEVSENAELMNTAKSNAETIIRDFLKSSEDTAEYQVIFQGNTAQS